MPEKERFFTPSRSYDVQLKIKDLDYSNDVTRVEIASSITKPYQLIIIDMFVDANDLILKELYGQDPIKLDIRLVQETRTLLEHVHYDLMYVTSPGFQLTSKMMLNTDNQKDRSSIRLITIPRKSFKTMTTLVNKVFITKTTRQMLQDLASETGATLKYDSENENTEVIDQIVIPPTTVYKSLQYLDSIVGLHTGISTYYCDNDNNLRISNLTTRMRKAQTFTINHLAQNNDNTEIINKSLDGKSFYTYDNIDTNYKGNSVFSVLSKNMKHIVKPRDTLYHIIERDLEEVCSEEGLISKNKKIHIDDNISDRTKYYINHNGYDETETFISVAKQISSLS